MTNLFLDCLGKMDKSPTCLGLCHQRYFTSTSSSNERYRKADASLTTWQQDGEKREFL